MPRVLVLGCGTGVGKSRLSAALLRRLAALDVPCLGLKPVESGIAIPPLERATLPPVGSDARLLHDASSLPTSLQHPLYALARPVSPHLAARAEGRSIDLSTITAWVLQAEAESALHTGPHRAIWTIVETAGGVFSPLASGISNFDLARALDPAIWILVGADALGVLHDVTATLGALTARGRSADELILSQAREPDASTGTNAAELEALGIARVAAVLERNADSSIDPWVDRLLTRSSG